MKKYLLIIFLTLSLSSNGQYYSIVTIPYEPAPYNGTAVVLEGNSFTPTIPIGFSFCYYGDIYDSIRIGSNGVVSFEQDYPHNHDCNWEIYDITLPNPWAALSAGIGVHMPWQDLDPSLGGSVSYSGEGVAPNRVFIVSFDNVPMDSCSKVFKGQTKLFETTNIIETHIETKDTCLSWNQGRAAHGLEGPPTLPLGSGAYGDFVTGRNYPNCVWTATNEGTRFAPLIDVCSSLSAGETDASTDDGFLIYPNPNGGAFSVDIPLSANKVILTNSLGQVLKSILTEGETKLDFEINKSGMYYLQVIIGNQVVTRKVVVLKK